MNEAEQLGRDICQSGAGVSAAQIGDIMPRSVSAPDLPVDDATKRISATALQGHVENLISQGLVPGQLGSFDAQVDADKKFYAAVRAEYCFYEARYIAALTQFLNQVSSPAGGDPSAVLAQTVALNRRLNSLLEVINYVGNDRAQKVNARGSEITAANKQIQDKLAVLAAQKEFLESGDAITKTQVEMTRYSAEKNRALNIQIMFFVALNVVALGTVLTVYRSAGAGGAA